MNSKKLLVVFYCAWIAVQAVLPAATIPAGTTVRVTMTDALSSHASPGRTFKTKLTSDLNANGKTVVPAGTVIFGVVETSRNAPGRTSTKPLMVNLTNIVINGQRVAIKTTGAVAPESFSARAGGQRVTGVSAGKSVVQAGSKLEFRLAEPLNL